MVAVAAATTGEQLQVLARPQSSVYASTVMGSSKAHGEALPGASGGWSAAQANGERKSTKRQLSVAGRVGTVTGVHIPVSLYRVLFGGGVAAVAAGPASVVAASSLLSQPV